MKKFSQITSIVLPLNKENVDTDQIIPARFLKATQRVSFADMLFFNWRYDKEGKPYKDNPFNQPFYQKAKILLVGQDFGIGSSREHAVWALYDWGIRVILGTTFGDIFYQNSFKNGLLIIKLTKEEIKKIFDKVSQKPDLQVSVDLRKRIITVADQTFSFTINPFFQKCLLNGIDEIGYILAQNSLIKKFEQKHKIW